MGRRSRNTLIIIIITQSRQGILSMCRYGLDLIGGYIVNICFFEVCNILYTYQLTIFIFQFPSWNFFKFHPHCSGNHSFLVSVHCLRQITMLYSHKAWGKDSQGFIHAHVQVGQLVGILIADHPLQLNNGALHIHTYTGTDTQTQTHRHTHTHTHTHLLKHTTQHTATLQMLTAYLHI